MVVARLPASVSARTRLLPALPCPSASPVRFSLALTVLTPSHSRSHPDPHPHSLRPQLLRARPRGHSLAQHQPLRRRRAQRGRRRDALGAAVQHVRGGVALTWFRRDRHPPPTIPTPPLGLSPPPSPPPPPRPRPPPGTATSSTTRRCCSSYSSAPSTPRSLPPSPKLTQRSRAAVWATARPASVVHHSSRDVLVGRRAPGGRQGRQGRQKWRESERAAAAGGGGGRAGGGGGEGRRGRDREGGRGGSALRAGRGRGEAQR